VSRLISKVVRLEEGRWKKGEGASGKAKETITFEIFEAEQLT
jgi:hypothetical protein